MSALSELLAGPAEGGVYRAPAGASMTTIERAAAAAGWKVAHADAGDSVDKRGVLAAFKDAFGFPDWFGHNLDALVDSLRDVSFEPGTLLVWDGAERLAEADPAQYREILSILRERAAADTSARLLTLLRPT